MNKWIEEHPQDVADIERLDQDDAQFKKVARRILNEPDREEEDEEEALEWAEKGF